MYWLWTSKNQVSFIDCSKIIWEKWWLGDRVRVWVVRAVFGGKFGKGVAGRCGMRRFFRHFGRIGSPSSELLPELHPKDPSGHFGCGLVDFCKHLPARFLSKASQVFLSVGFPYIWDLNFLHHHHAGARSSLWELQTWATSVSSEGYLNSDMCWPFFKACPLVH